MKPRDRSNGNQSWPRDILAIYMIAAGIDVVFGGSTSNDLCFALLSTKSALWPVSYGSSNRSSRRHCITIRPHLRASPSVTMFRHYINGEESRRAPRLWFGDRRVGRSRQHTIHCNKTTGHVSTTTESVRTQDGAWADTTADKSSQEINSARPHNSFVGTAGCSWQSPLSNIQEEDKQKKKQARVRPITAEKNISANDIASYWGEEGLSRREGDGKTAPSDDLEGGLRVPRHVAFVMDGNGRWAVDRNMPRRAGHVEGAIRAGEVVEACRQLGVEFVTLYAFSTENWNRPAAEVTFLMKLMEKTLQEQREGLRRNGIHLTAIGELHRLPPRLRSLLEEIQLETRGYVEEADPAERIASTGTKDTTSRRNAAAVATTTTTTTTTTGTPWLPSVDTVKTAPAVSKPSRSNEAEVAGDDPRVNSEKNCDRGEIGKISRRPPPMTLCLAISYGGRAEVARAARELAEEANAGRLDPGDIDEEALGMRLSTARLGIPDPDLVVRTSGESRLSNLLLWQAAYSELCVIGKAWPEFRRPDLVEAFRDFGMRKRRYGRIPDHAADPPYRETGKPSR